MIKALSFADILREERLREYNQCHTPGGPTGGQFCNDGDAAFVSDDQQATAVGGWSRLAILRQVSPVPVRAEHLPLLKQAANDWTTGRAHMTRNGKYYRVRTSGSDVPTSRFGGKSSVPAWAKIVKRYFPSSESFHKFASAT